MIQRHCAEVTSLHDGILEGAFTDIHQIQDNAIKDSHNQPTQTDTDQMSHAVSPVGQWGLPSRHIKPNHTAFVKPETDLSDSSKNFLTED